MRCGWGVWVRAMPWRFGKKLPGLAPKPGPGSVRIGPYTVGDLVLVGIELHRTASGILGGGEVSSREKNIATDEHR